MIIAAAIYIDGLVLSVEQPKTHRHILNALHTSTNIGWLFMAMDKGINGFLTHTGEFLNRSNAWKHVHDCGQGTPKRDALLMTALNTYNGTELYSEDLW